MNKIMTLCVSTVLLVTTAVSAHANNVNQATALIDHAMTESLDIINDPVLTTEVKREKLWPIVTSYFDFDLISELTLGKFSAGSTSPLGDYSDRRFTSEQQAEFTDAFTIHLGNLYLDRLNNDSKFSVLLTKSSAMKPIRQMQRARVNSLINKKTAIDYSLRFKDDEWRIYDVKVEGRSLISSFRKEYSALLLKKTPDELLALLNEKNLAHTGNNVAQ
ncbi:ABC transporter substrate-binding protein [Moritella marina ATCC 15381]|uniref:ABC transporter substrate-binding protein n=1 Tax=Moritella marina ATCC 15381 TaxID=1202962 RepID=A0A5J6WML7_MORMI|nr:ABC transporter substrate-binding protein [Moritella marina]QFI38684.1 ABC transporter substrate-binding protein [Moritella marina ATCC 15381]